MSTKLTVAGAALGIAVAAESVCIGVMLERDGRTAEELFASVSKLPRGIATVLSGQDGDLRLEVVRPLKLSDAERATLLELKSFVERPPVLEEEGNDPERLKEVLAKIPVAETQITRIEQMGRERATSPDEARFIDAIAARKYADAAQILPSILKAAGGQLVFRVAGSASSFEDDPVTPGAHLIEVAEGINGQRVGAACHAGFIRPTSVEFTSTMSCGFGEPKTP